MYRYKDIIEVHIEPTQNCNAACLQCDRNKNGGEDNQYLTGAELTDIDYKDIFSSSFIGQLKSMYMCGNLGDPCISKYSLDGYRHFRQNNNMVWLGMNTNGGARDVTYWQELADIIGKKGIVTFSVDGLEDTNHLYRQKVKWEKVVENAQAFIDAGGRARWDYLVFKHNEYQVEEANQLANKMVFEEFRAKKTGRFFSTITHKGKPEHQGTNRKGEDTQKLEIPKQEKFVNKALKKESVIIDKHGSMEEYYKTCEISCKVQKQKSIFISAEGLFLPCCWVAGQMYKWYWKPKHSDVWKFMDLQDLNVKKNSLKEVMEGPFLKAIEESWQHPYRPKVCANKCGVGFDAYSEQFK